MITVKLEKQSIEFPTEWNDLTQEQYLGVMHIFTLSEDRYYIKVAVLRLLLGMDWKKFTKLSSTRLGEIVHFHLRWLDEEPKFTNNPLKKIYLGLHKYMAPLPSLADFTFQQFFEYSEQFFAFYVKTRKREYLDSLCTCTYLATSQGQKDSFSQYNFSLHEQNFRKAPEGAKLAIFYAYVNEREKLIKKYPKLFSNKGSSDKSKARFSKLVDSLNLGNMASNEAIKSTYIFEACERLTDLIEQAAKNKNKK